MGGLMTVTNITAKPAATAGEPEAGLLDALRRTETAVAAMRSGDPEPYIAVGPNARTQRCLARGGPSKKEAERCSTRFAGWAADTRATAPQSAPP